MTKQEIVARLTENHLLFKEAISRLTEKEFTTAPEGKWTPGQHFQHIILSVSPVVTAFRLPLFILKFFFGQANRPSRSYEGLVKRYEEKLALGGRASARFVPQQVSYSQQQSLLKKYDRVVKDLCKLALKTNEMNLDKYILPHPLLGKLTLREMLYFSAHHVYHHYNICMKYRVQKEF